MGVVNCPPRSSPGSLSRGTAFCANLSFTDKEGRVRRNAESSARRSFDEYPAQVPKMRQVALTVALPKLQNALTAEAAVSSPVVPAMHSQELTGTAAFLPGHKKGQKRYRKQPLSLRPTSLPMPGIRDHWLRGSLYALTDWFRLASDR